MTAITPIFEDEFRAALRSIDDDLTQPVTSEQLFSAWFRSRGHSYFFLFTKNLSVTSLQYAELLSLIRVHAPDSSGQPSHLQFLTIGDFFRDFKEPLKDFQQTTINRDSLADTLIDLYGNWLRQLIVVELFFGSCSVFVPPHLKLDDKFLYSVCRESGYIHSCGYSIYARRFEELDPNDIVKKLRAHLKRNHGTPAPKHFVTVYAHEDFTKDDREHAAKLSGGLDDSKIFVEKYYVGPKRFVAFIDQLRKEIGKEIYIPPPGPYKAQRKEAVQNGCVSESTIWFIVDRAIGDKSRQPANERFLVCYEQRYKNYNPFHIFDENKPAWVSHTTIPHTLAGAMINLTRPWWPPDRPAAVADPFSGTGTVWLECHKLGDVKHGIQLHCSDLAPIAPLLAEDNRKFFLLDINELNKLSGELMQAVKPSQPRLAVPKIRGYSHIKKLNKSYDRALKLFNKVTSAEQTEEDLDISQDIVKKLLNYSFLERLLFYVCLRTHVRHLEGFKRGSKQWDEAFLKEINVLSGQIKELIDLRTMEGKNKGQCQGSSSEFVGTYSLGTGVSLTDMKSWKDSAPVSRHDAQETLDELVDVIITDPPYGFNTNEKPKKLAEVYAKSLRAMIGSLNDGGQIVIAVPERSYTGRQVKSFCMRGWLTQQVLAEARAAGYEVVVSAQLFPRPGRIFFPPYYWESEKALGRSVLHFRFRKISVNSQA